MAYTADQMVMLQAVQTEVNEIPYNAIVGSTESYDEWFDAPEAGDSWECRDYTLRKAQRLREQGWPPADMTVILCYTELNEYHAVLGVLAPDDTTTWILDNRVPQIYPMATPPYPYRWERRQVAGTTEFAPIA